MPRVTARPASGADAPAEPEDQGWLLGGRYRILDLIGRGGMAEVHRGHDELLDRMVAVKLFRAPSADSADGTERIRQQAEVHALAALNHPNLTTLFDASVESTPPFLVLELIDGPSLAAALADGPLTEASVRSIGIQVADALAYVHDRNMVHRDVKPANVLLGNDATSVDTSWRVRLSDFGIVRLLGTQRLTQVNFTLGSASYLAPEQARGADVGPEADIYSLGLVLIEALTGRVCFDGSAPEALAARLTTSPAIPMDAPAPWPGLLAAMTALDPQARPSAAEVATALRDPHPVAVDAFAPTVGMAAVAAAPLAAAGLAGAPMPVDDEVDDEFVEPERRHRAGLIAACLLAVVIAGVVALLHSSFPGLHSQTPAAVDKTSTGSTQQVQLGNAKHTSSSAATSKSAGHTRAAPAASRGSQPTTATRSTPTRIVPPPSASHTHPVSTPTPSPSPSSSASSTNAAQSPTSTPTSTPTGA